MVRPSALDIKLLRDLWRLKGQIAAIACVIGAGIALLIATFGCMESLRASQEAFYTHYRFADVFASLKRAPITVAPRLREVPGVANVDTRVVVDVSLDVPGMSDPVTGRMLSYPDRTGLQLNALALLEGRWISSLQPSEVLVTQDFAKAHGFRPGDFLFGTINGKRQRLDIVGIVLSPEWVYSLAPGHLMPDSKRFGVLWMGARALSAAFDMVDGFNSVTASLLHGAAVQDVLARFDDILRPYGGFGSFARADQVSHFFLNNELEQLKTIGTIAPPIFLLVAAFLLNIVVTRLVTTEREQIGLLKAFGYTDGEVAWHYLKLVLAITVLGYLCGVGAGVWLGQQMTRLYTEYFKFPLLEYRIHAPVVLVAAGTAAVAGLAGGLSAVWSAARLSPATAMAPPVPASYRHGWLAPLAAGLRISQPTRMIFRHVVRWPVRTAVTIVGIALSVALMVAALFFMDSVDRVIEIHFFKAERETLTVFFTEPRTAAVEGEIRHLPGVLATQPARTVAVELVHGPRTKRTLIRGVPDHADLSRILDTRMRPIAPPTGGLALSRHIAQDLGIRLGDSVTVRVLQERRPVAEVPVTMITEEYLGFSGYMSMPALHRLMQEGDLLSGVHIFADPRAQGLLYRRLKDMPAVAGVAQTKAALASFEDSMNRTMYVMIAFYVGFAGIIAFGVAYNSARIAFSERVRALASLWVLGFTSGEVAYILLGELGVQTLIALPVGCIFGNGLAHVLSPILETDMYNFPLVIDSSTYATAVLVSTAAGLFCSALLWRRVYGLDLVAVLKTRE